MRKILECGMVMGLALVLGLPAVAEEKKLIEKKPAGKEPATEEEFVAHAIACSHAEIKCSEYVAKNGATEDVRKFAQKMVEDHTKLLDQLMERAKELKIAVVTGLDKDKQEKFDQLKKLKGNDFDKEFMRCQVEDHEKGIKQFEAWATKAKDEKLRDVIRRAVPTLKDHLEHARKLHTNLKG